VRVQRRAVRSSLASVHARTRAPRAPIDNDMRLAATAMACCVAVSALHRPQPGLPRPPQPCHCLQNSNLRRADPKNASQPLGWSSYTWGNSTFSWETPPTGQCAVQPAVTKVLQVTGGSGSWSASLDPSSLPRDASWEDGSTAIVSVVVSFCTLNVRPGAKLEIYFTGKHNVPMPGYDDQETLGWATHSLTAGVNISTATEASFGDIRLPVGGSPEFKLALRLDDGPATSPTSPPTTVFFTNVQVAQLQPPVPVGLAASLPTVPSGVELWSEHASHKVFPTALGPPRGGKPTSSILTFPSTMKGGTAATQLVFRQPVDVAGMNTTMRCSLTWDARASTLGLQALLVLPVNMSRVSGTYGTRGLHPDPLLPLQPGMWFRVQAGVAHPVALKVKVPHTAAEASVHATLTVQCGSRRRVEEARAASTTTITLETPVWDLLLPQVPTVKTHTNMWIANVLALGPHDGREWHARDVVHAFYSSIWNSRAQTYFETKSCSNSLPHFNPATGTPSSAVNTSCFEHTMEEIISGSPSGQNQFFTIPGLYLGEDHGFKITWQGLPVFENDDMTLTEQFEQGYAAVAQAYLSLLKLRGIAPEHRQIKLVDEPSWRKPHALKQCVALFRFTKSLCKPFGGCSIRTSGTLPIPGEVLGLLGPTDVWDVHADFLSPSSAAIATARGLRLTVYDNAVALIDQPVLRARAFVWEQFQQRADIIGSLSWWSDTDYPGGSAPGEPVVSPWVSDGVVGKRVVNGDGQLFYDSWSAPNVTIPSVANDEFQVCTSLRWENFALGLQDYELLRLAAEAEEQTKASDTTAGGNTTSRISQTGLNVSQLVGLVSQGWAHVQPANDQPFTVDCAMLEWVRGELASLASTSEFYGRTGRTV
jgi:hypothetical protein